MSTYNDIRVKFANAMKVNESKLTVWQQGMKDVYSVIKPKGRWITPKSGEILRAEIDPNDPEGGIEEFLTACNIQPNDYSISSGNWSGKFDSWNITFNKDVDYFGKTLSSGKAYGITSAIDFTNGVKQVIGDKDLTPDNLNLSGDYSSQADIVSRAKAAISSKVNNEIYRDFCLDLIEAVQLQGKAFNTVDDVEGVNKEFVIDYNFSEYVGKIDPKSIKTIQKDFGEVLGGIFMFNLVGKTGSGLKFPTESNLELVDFFFNGLQISSKAGKGAKASAGGYITAIENSMKIGKWSLTPAEDKVFKDVLNPLKGDATKEPKNSVHLPRAGGSTTFSNAINMFNIHDCKTWSYWVGATGISPGNVNRDTIIQSFIDLKESGKLQKTLSGYLRIATVGTSRGQNGKLVNGLIKAKNERQAAAALDAIIDSKVYDILIGLILYPGTKELAALINTKYADTLTTLINKALTVKQLYLDLYIKKSSIRFKMKAMENSNFKVGSLNGIDSWKVKGMSIYLA